MDNSTQDQSAKIKNQNVPGDDNAQQAPIVSVGGGAKEQGPVATSSPAEMAPRPETAEVSQELKEAGVEVAPNKPELHPDIQKVGVTHAQDAVSVGGTPQSDLHLPMTEAKAEEQLKTHPSITDPARWIAGLVVKAYRVAAQRMTPKE